MPASQRATLTRRQSPPMSPSNALHRPPPSRIAARVRRHRQRRERGEVPVTAVLSHGFIRALVDYGWLQSDQMSDRRAVAAAFRGFCARAFAVSRADDGYE